MKFYIYSSFHISIAAVCFSAEIFFLLDLQTNYYFLGFVGVSTILTYSLHRIFGNSKISKDELADRFTIIRSMLSLIKVLAVVSAIALAYILYHIPQQMWIHFGISGVICFLYVLPVMHSQKKITGSPVYQDLFHCTCMGICCQYTGFHGSFTIDTYTGHIADIY